MKPLLLLLLLPCFFLSHPLLAEEPAKTLPGSREQISLSFAPLVKKAAPAVVNIYTRRTIKTRSLSPFFNDPVFKQFLGEDFKSGLMRERIEKSLGSGVIVKPTGLIVTNNHVIKDSDEITIVLTDKREFHAKVLLTDDKTDLALLTIDTQGESLPFLTLYDSDKLEVGDMVLAIGNPFGVGQTVTSGIVSALARTTVGAGDFQFFIQTDAAINPGNSGGALVNMEGKLAGVNTAILSSSGGSNGVGFAIPANMVRTIINSGSNGSKSKPGHIIRPWLGAVTQDVTPEIAATLGIKRPSGVLVSDLYPGGPAEKSGLHRGDIITKLDEHDISDEPSLRFHIATYSIGKTAKLHVLRDGQDTVLSLSMQPPIEVPARDARALKDDHPLSGSVVVNLSPALADELRLNRMKGVAVWEVSGGSIAERLGFERGDVLEAINNTTIISTDQITTVLASKAKIWDIVITRGSKRLTLKIQ